MTQDALKLKRLLVTGSIWTLVHYGLSALLSLGSSALLARHLHAADFGIYAMINVVTSLFSASSGLCIGAALIQHRDLSEDEISSAFWLHIFTNLIIFAVISAMSPLVASLFNEPTLCKLLPICALSYVIGSFGQLYAFLLEKEIAFALQAKQEMAAEFISTAVTLGLAFYGMGVWSLVWGALTLHSLASLFRFWAGWQRWKPRFHFRWGDIRKFLRFGLYQMGEGTLISVSYKLDQLLIGWLLGATALGLYEFVIQRFLYPLGTISLILQRNAFPYFARIQYEKLTLRRSFISLSKLLNIVDAPLLLGTAAMAPMIVPPLFGKEWMAAVPIIPLLAAVQMLRRINNQSCTLMMATGKPESSFRWHLVILLCCSVAIIPGAMGYGVTGVTVAVFIMMVLGNIAGYFFLLRPVIGECGGELTASFLKPVLLAVIIGVLARQLPPVADFSTNYMIITTSVGLTVYTGLLWIIDRKALTSWNEV